MAKIQNGIEETGAVLEGNFPLRTRENSEGVTKFVDILADYIADNVTESLRAVQEALEKRMILRALREAAGNQRKAARILGVKPTTLSYKLKKHQIRIKKTFF